MAKIVIDARELRTSTGRYVERLLHHLQEVEEQKGNEYEYVVLLKPQDIDGWQPSNSHFTKISCPYKEFTFAEQLGLLRQIQKLKPDLVHFCLTQQPILYNRKVVTTVHDLTTARFRNPAKNPVIFWIKQQVYKAVIHIVARKSRFVIVPTNFVKADVENYTHITPDKIYVTYESADKIEEPTEPIQELKGARFIMYVGRPQPHKNLGRLLDAFKLLKEKHPDLKLVLAGKKDALYEQHEERAKREGIKDVVFTDFVSQGQLRWLYENCEAYVFPSLSEGFGLPALEAMAQGAPVVSSNATCLPEVYHEAAQYFDPTDIDGMAVAIEGVITNLKLRQQLIERGQLRAADFSWKRMARETRRVYKKALRQK